MKDEVEKLIAVDITLTIDEDVQLLVNGVPVFTITQEQRVYRAVVSNPNAPAALLALFQKAQVEAVRAELEKIDSAHANAFGRGKFLLHEYIKDRLANLAKK